MKNKFFNIRCINWGSSLTRQRYGVPQGSVLGPLLFILATNDLAMTLKKCKCILFADDTTLYISDKNIRYLKEHMKHDLEIMIDWFKANRLTLNLDKTSFVLFQPPGNKNNDEITLSVDIRRFRNNCEIVEEPNSSAKNRVRVKFFSLITWSLVFW